MPIMHWLKMLLGVLFAVSGVCASEEYNTAIIIGGGNAGKGNEVEFWPKKSNCPLLDNLPLSLFGHSAATIESLVYTCGGNNFPDSFSECYSTDLLGDGLWQPSESMNEKRSEFSLLGMDGSLLAIGGWNQVSYLDSIEIFDRHSWMVADFTLHTPRYAHCSVKVNDKEVMVLGGGGYDGRLTSVEKVNIAKGTSTYMEEMTMPRMYFGCSYDEEENRVYVSGGQGTSSLVEYLDITTGKWTRIANMDLGRDGHKMGKIGGKLTVWGGSHNYEYTNTVEQYANEENVWETVENLQTARYDMAMVEVAC